MNAVQEEIANVIEGSGDDLNKPDNTQLFQAIQGLIAASQASNPFSTGDAKLTLKTTADQGWIICDDGDYRFRPPAVLARAPTPDTEPLYTLIWDNVIDAHAPVAGGRGANAAADFAADKPIALPKALGRALAIAGTGTGLTARALGAAIGEEIHLLTSAESGFT